MLPNQRMRIKIQTWRKVKLDEGDGLSLIIDHRGITPKKLGGSWDSVGIPALSAKNIKNGQIINKADIRYISQKLYDKWMPKKLERGDIFLTSEAPLGELYFLNKKTDYCLSQRLFALRSNPDVLDPQYLYYYLKSSVGQHELMRRISGTAAQGIRQAELRKVEITVPVNMQEQRRIVLTLSSFDDKIELNIKISKNLEQTAQAIFKEWFVKFKFPGHEKVKMVDSELGKIPEGWEAKKLPEVFDFLEGPGIRNWQYRLSGCPFINIRLIQSNDIDIKSASFISKEEANGKYKHFHLQERDMVVSTSGTLGRSAIVRKEHLPLLLNTSVIKFRPIDKQNYAFMYQFLNSAYFQNKILNMASGSAQPNFGPVHLKQIEVLVPDKNILDKFSNIANPLYEKIIAIMSENQKLTALRDLLLPKLMSGGIRI